MARRPKLSWTSVKGGRRAMRRPWKRGLTRGEIVARKTSRTGVKDG